jgi:hypothetical protein
MIWVHAWRRPSIPALLEITSEEQLQDIPERQNRPRDCLIDMMLLHGWLLLAKKFVGWAELLRNPSSARDGFRKSSTHPTIKKARCGFPPGRNS